MSKSNAIQYLKDKALINENQSNIYDNPIIQEIILSNRIGSISGEIAKQLNIEDDSCDSFDLFWNDDLTGHYLDGKRLCLDEPWLPVEEIFNFDISVFKSFDSWTDSSD